MSEKNDKIQFDFFRNILDDYATTCGVEPFTGEIIISNDMEETYKQLRNDLVKKGKINIAELNNYNGLTVQPANTENEFTIVLNQKYILETIEQKNINWVGTLIHEATHVNDFKDYFKLIRAKTYDELFDYDSHRIFNYWTEFHARAVGHYFLRKHTLEDFKDVCHIEHILNTELPYHINNLIESVESTQNFDSQMYSIVHFLGRIAVWQYLYPDTFNDDAICDLTDNNPWMKEVYDVFIKYRSLEELYPHFDEIEKIIVDNYAANE